MADAAHCPACGAELGQRSAGRADRPWEQLKRDDEQQTSSDREQTASDEDQTSSGHDQSLSDSDQQSSDDDQHAADDDLAAGGSTAAHRRTTNERAQTRTARGAIAAFRDEVALARDETAAERDRLSNLREAQSQIETTADGLFPHDDLALARSFRAQAAADRIQAAVDRARAATDRERAASERAEALRILEESENNLKDARTDALTGTWTRKFGLDEAARELGRAHRMGTALVLAFVDIDGLKEVNDLQGHQAGDSLLQQTGERLRMSFRTYDLIVRYGGDEFVCILPSLNKINAKARFEQIRREIEERNRGHSIGYGIAETCAPEALEELIARTGRCRADRVQENAQGSMRRSDAHPRSGYYVSPAGATGRRAAATCLWIALRAAT